MKSIIQISEKEQLPTSLKKIATFNTQTTISNPKQLLFKIQNSSKNIVSFKLPLH